VSAGEDIAVIGMACRFPGARNKVEFWDNLCAGRESRTCLGDEALLTAGVSRNQIDRPTYVKSTFALPDFDRFDAHFFGVTSDEARIMDPQQRVFLEIAYEALEDAAHTTISQRRSTGVFASGGGVTTSYLSHYGPILSGCPHGTASQIQIGNDKDFLATRVSYKLNLTGASLTVQTACSSSIVALHLARTALLMRDVDLALVGASCIRVPHYAGYDSAENPLLSADGHCKAFSEDANGVVFGSGAGAVILKRYSDAVNDNDHIYALIKSTALTNDGAAKIGYTASSVPGQAKAMAQAIAVTGVTAADFGYVECHGTATKIGDPLELKALEKVFRLDTNEKHFCGIGSVKTNIGHLEQAAGIAGLIKVALMLKHRTLVPSINFSRENAKINFSESPFTVVRKTEAWIPRPEPRTAGGLVAGVNSLGIGGTNAFAVMAEVPDEPGNPGTAQALEEDLVCVSAKTRDQLLQYLDILGGFAGQDGPIPIGDLCHTINISRSHHRVRSCGVLGPNTAVAEWFHVSARADAVESQEYGLAKEAIYVCNPDHFLDDPAAASVMRDPRFRVLREFYAELLAGFGAAARGPCDTARLYRTAALEIALSRQLTAWGVRLKRVVAPGHGSLAACLENPGALTDAELSTACADLRIWLKVSDSPGTGSSAPPPETPELWRREPADKNSYVIFRIRPRAAEFQAGAGKTASFGYLEESCSRLSKHDILMCLAGYIAAGNDLDWEAYYEHTSARKIPLPTYPFSRDRYWIDDD
jgi:acyl transferase domain-containing protein